MRWSQNKTNEFKWHRWFAWYPVQVPLFEEYSDQDVYKYEWVWLEEVERQYFYTSSQGDGDWYYRLIK